VYGEVAAAFVVHGPVRLGAWRRVADDGQLNCTLELVLEMLMIPGVTGGAT
jgi:hypothetical protein